MSNKDTASGKHREPLIDRLTNYARDYTFTSYHDDLIMEAIKTIEAYELKHLQDGERLTDQSKRIAELEAKLTEYKKYLPYSHEDRKP